MRGGGLDQARTECLDRERWRLFCHGHPLGGHSRKERGIGAIDSKPNSMVIMPHLNVHIHRFALLTQKSEVIKAFAKLINYTNLIDIIIYESLLFQLFTYPFFVLQHSTLAHFICHNVQLLFCFFHDNFTY